MTRSRSSAACRGPTSRTVQAAQKIATPTDLLGRPRPARSTSSFAFSCQRQVLVRAARSMSANVCGLVGCGSRRVRTPALTMPVRVGRCSPVFVSTPAGRATGRRARRRSHELAVRETLLELTAESVRAPAVGLDPGATRVRPGRSGPSIGRGGLSPPGRPTATSATQPSVGGVLPHRFVDRDACPPLMTCSRLNDASVLADERHGVKAGPVDTSKTATTPALTRPGPRTLAMEPHGDASWVPHRRGRPRNRDFPACMLAAQ
jgi:hypothetical protein